MKPEDAQRHLDRIAPSRSLPRRDQTLGFLTDKFKREVEKPFKQLGDLMELWQNLLPESLTKHTRLVGLSRGVLHVEADSSAVHYELDQLLRGGKQVDLIKLHHGPAFRRVQIKVGSSTPATPSDPKRQPPAGDADGSLAPERQAPRSKGG